MQNKALAMLGMATKAGKTVSGEFSVEKMVKSGKGRLVIVAEDASDNAKKSYTDMCTFYKVPIYIMFDRESLGHSMGQQSRVSACVTDAGFAKAIVQYLK
ncbi:MAG: L7Ae/L30e/S12e/Gadd45 family ribosomal protein [Lachnospiraceae bacterium]